MKVRYYRQRWNPRVLRLYRYGFNWRGEQWRCYAVTVWSHEFDVSFRGRTSKEESTQ